MEAIRSSEKIELSNGKIGRALKKSKILASALVGALFVVMSVGIASAASLPDEQWSPTPATPAAPKTPAKPVSTTITCVKGTVRKTVTAVKPTCPTGYVKK
jgi:hypothetical protein